MKDHKDTKESVKSKEKSNEDKDSKRKKKKKKKKIKNIDEAPPEKSIVNQSNTMNTLNTLNSVKSIKINKSVKGDEPKEKIITKYVDKSKEKDNNKKNNENKDNKENIENKENKENKEDKDQKKNKIIMKDERDIVNKLLIDKQNTVLNDLKVLKENKQFITNISMKNINTTKSVIDNNINNDELKSIINKEKELEDKLYSIKSQINLLPLSNNNKNSINTNNLKNYLKNYKNEIKSANFMSKLKKINNTQKNCHLKNEEYLKQLEEQMIKENEEEKNLRNKEKEEFLQDQKIKEKSIILKRRKKIDEKIQNIMKSKGVNDNVKKNYLYLQMENEFLENEKNKLNNAKKQRKLKLLSPEETEINIKKINEIRHKLEERAEKQKKDLHKLWRSRSSILQNLQSPTFKDLNNKIVSKEERMKELIQLKKDYIKYNIKLPPISEILKKDIRNKIKKNSSNFIRNRNININNNINKKNFHSDNNLSTHENLNNKKISNESSLSRNIFKSLSSQSTGGSHIKSLKYFKNDLNNKICKKIIKSPHDLNYLEEIRQKRKIKNSDNKFNNISKEKKEKSNSDINDYNLRLKIEAMESKYERNKILLKLQGGYLNNKELGDNMNELLIDSIKGKLSLIENQENKG